MKIRALSIALGAAIAMAAIGVRASGQAGQPAAPARTQMDELLAEVRGIRADLERASAASTRGQLLGMRLQLQEQRIAALSRQLSDVQDKLHSNTYAKTAMLGPMKMFADMKKDSDAEEAKTMATVFGPLKQQLEALDKAEAELRNEEAALAGQLHTEQSRWAAFNAQIEELERAAAKAIR
jgi:chromosome segregation ATPase